jgi:Endonuclease NucS
MFALSRLISIDDEGGLALNRPEVRHFRRYLADYVREHAYIEFANEKDWIAYFGDPDKAPTIETALDYYVNKGDVAAAIETKKKQTSSKRELGEFEDMIISEKAVEDYLEGNLDVIGSKIGADLVLLGRQYSTPVGPIDLLTRDKKTSDYVVIELKKGRSADKVYGQCSRYMGWVRTKPSSRESVHGAIVARHRQQAQGGARRSRHQGAPDRVRDEGGRECRVKRSDASVTISRWSCDSACFA